MHAGRADKDPAAKYYKVKPDTSLAPSAQHHTHHVSGRAQAFLCKENSPMRLEQHTADPDFPPGFDPALCLHSMHSLSNIMSGLSSTPPHSKGHPSRAKAQTHPSMSQRTSASSNCLSSPSLPRSNSLPLSTPTEMPPGVRPPPGLSQAAKTASASSYTITSPADSTKARLQASPGHTYNPKQTAQEALQLVSGRARPLASGVFIPTLPSALKDKLPGPPETHASESHSPAPPAASHSATDVRKMSVHMVGQHESGSRLASTRPQASLLTKAAPARSLSNTSLLEISFPSGTTSTDDPRLTKSTAQSPGSPLSRLHSPDSSLDITKASGTNTGKLCAPA